MTDVAIGAVAYRLFPEIPAKKLFWIKMLEEMSGKIGIPTISIPKKAALIDVENNGIIINNSE
jgi:hypothetical protein